MTQPSKKDIIERLQDLPEDKEVAKLAANEIKILREQIRRIAHDYVELSYEKAMWQRDDYIKSCRKAYRESFDRYLK